MVGIDFQGPVFDNPLEFDFEPLIGKVPAVRNCISSFG